MNAPLLKTATDTIEAWAIAAHQAADLDVTADKVFADAYQNCPDKDGKCAPEAHRKVYADGASADARLEAKHAAIRARAHQYLVEATLAAMGGLDR